MGAVGPLRWVCVLIWVAFVVSKKSRSEISFTKVPVVDGIPNCDSNCTYLSSDGSTSTWMSCHIDNCETLPEQKDRVSEPPKRKGISFVKYKEPQSAEESLILSIKFSPEALGSIIYTKGMFVHIYDGKTNYKRCYKLEKKMSFHPNSKDTFHDVCFMPAQTNLTLYSSIYIIISSLPLKSDSPYETSDKFIIRADNDTNDNILYGNSSSISCHDSTFLYEYVVGPSYGDTASVTVCQEDVNDACKIGTERNFFNLPLIGSMNISVTSPNTNHIVLLRGTNSFNVSSKTYANFSGCVDMSSSSTLVLSLLLPIMLVVGAVCAILIVDFSCLRERIKRKETPRTHEYRQVCVEEKYTISDFPSKKIFVLVKEDDYEHTIVVDVFCTILSSIYGQNAFPQFRSKEYVENPWAHILKNIKEADKVLVVCSGTKDCEDEEDIFSRAVCLVRDQASMLVNTVKFMICYFNYDTHDCIPEDLKHIRHRYELMEDFEKLFFAIIEKEKYLQNGMINYTKVQPEAHDWNALDAAILRMRRKRNSLSVESGDTDNSLHLPESQQDNLDEDARDNNPGDDYGESAPDQKDSELCDDGTTEDLDSGIDISPNTDDNRRQIINTVPKTI